MKKNILSLAILFVSICTLNSCGGDNIDPFYTHDPNAVVLDITAMIGDREGTATVSLQNGQYETINMSAAVSGKEVEGTNSVVRMTIAEPKEITSSLIMSSFHPTEKNKYIFNLEDIASKELAKDNIPTYFKSWYKEYPNLSRVVFQTLKCSDGSYNHLTETMSFTCTGQIYVYVLENDKEILITGVQGIVYKFNDLKIK